MTNNIERLTLAESLNIEILGDPHLGRIFKTGVPLDRLGDREALQMEDFLKSLMNPCYKTHVCLGDLFDKFRVSHEVLLATATAYEAAAERNPDTTYIIIQGNHDNSRDTEKVSSFSIFQRMVSHVDNIWVLTTNHLIRDDMLFIPWSPWHTARESLQTYVENQQKFKAVFVHWDIDDYGNEDATHVLPIDMLREITDTVVLGHYHKPSLKVVSGVKVCIWGSMQPYAHGEEEEPEMYLTHTVSEVENFLERDQSYYRNKCLRVLLDSDEKPLAGIDCLALTHKRSTSNTEIELEVSVDEFSLSSVLEATFAEFGVSPEITQEIKNQL